MKYFVLSPPGITVVGASDSRGYLSCMALCRTSSGAGEALILPRSGTRRSGVSEPGWPDCDAGLVFKGDAVDFYIKINASVN